MFPNAMRTLGDFQQFHRWLDEQKGFTNEDANRLMVLLTGEVGEVAQIIKQLGRPSARLQPGEPWPESLRGYRAELGEELADCLAYLLKLANWAGIDMHEAYLAKMERNIHREWPDPLDDTPAAREES